MCILFLHLCKNRKEIHTHAYICLSMHRLCLEDKQEALNSGYLWEWETSDLTFRFYCVLFCTV